MGGPPPKPPVLMAEGLKGAACARCGRGARALWYAASGSIVFETGFGLKVTLRGGFGGRADSGDGGPAERRGVSSETALSAMATAMGTRAAADHGRCLKQSLGPSLASNETRATKHWLPFHMSVKVLSMLRCLASGIWRPPLQGFPGELVSIGKELAKLNCGFWVWGCLMTSRPLAKDPSSPPAGRALTRACSCEF